MISSAPLVLVAAIGPKDVLLVVFALLAVGLLSTFLFMRNKLRESLVEKTRSDFAEELLAKFRRGMESRIGGGVTPKKSSPAFSTLSVSKRPLERYWSKRLVSRSM